MDRRDHLRGRLPLVAVLVEPSASMLSYTAGFAMLVYVDVKLALSLVAGVPACLLASFPLLLSWFLRCCVHLSACLPVCLSASPRLPSPCLAFPCPVYLVWSASLSPPCLCLSFSLSLAFFLVQVLLATGFQVCSATCFLIPNTYQRVGTAISGPLLSGNRHPGTCLRRLLYSRCLQLKSRRPSPS